MGTFVIEVEDNGKIRNFRIDDVPSREAAIARAQEQIDLEHNGVAVDDFGHPTDVPIPEGDNPVTRPMKEFGKGAVSGAVSINPIDMMMNMQGYLADKISQITGMERGADVRQLMQGGGQGWVERNVLPAPVQGYDKIRHAGEFVGASVIPGAAVRSAAVAAPGIASRVLGTTAATTAAPTTAQAVARGVGTVGRGAARDLTTAAIGTGTSAAAHHGLGLGAKYASNFMGSQYAPNLQAAAELIGDIGGGIWGARAGNDMVGGSTTNTRRFPGSERNAEILRQNNIPMTAGQETGNPALRMTEDNARNLPGGSYVNDILTEQNAAAHRAVASLMGHELTDPNGLWTPDEWLAVKQKFRDQYGDLTSRNDLMRDPQFDTDVGSVIQAYDRVAPQGNLRPRVVGDYVDMLNAEGPIVTGDRYQALHSLLSDQIRSLTKGGVSPYELEALTGIRQAWRDNMGRSISPADRGLWDAANRQYNVYKLVQRPTSMAGGESAGNFNLPFSRIRSEAARRDPNAYVEGRSDIGNLSRAVDTIAQPPRSSGTAERSLAQNLYQSGPTATIGATAGTALGGPMGGVVGGLIGGSLPAIVTGFQGSRLGQQVARGMNAAPPVQGGPMFNAFQTYAPTTAAAMPAPIDSDFVGGVTFDPRGR
jgi:hypothetical protein